jgi:hypothetical protein
LLSQMQLMSSKNLVCGSSRYLSTFFLLLLLMLLASNIL